jgi:hypothetical protein
MQLNWLTPVSCYCRDHSHLIKLLITFMLCGMRLPHSFSALYASKKALLFYEKQTFMPFKVTLYVY